MGFFHKPLGQTFFKKSKTFLKLAEMWLSKIFINVEDMLVKKKKKSCLGKVCHKLKNSSFEGFFFFFWSVWEEPREASGVGGTKGMVDGGCGAGGVGGAQGQSVDTDWESHFQMQVSLTGRDLGRQRWAWAWLPFHS